MFDVGFWELVLIFGVGLMILGPERMPRVASQIGRWVGRARRTASSLRRQLEQEIASADAPPPPPKRKPTHIKPVNTPKPEKPEERADADGDEAPADASIDKPDPPAAATPQAASPEREASEDDDADKETGSSAGGS